MILFRNERDESSLSAAHCLCCSCSYILHKVVTLEKQSKEWKLLNLFQSCLMRLYLSPHDLASVITSISVLISWGSWSKVSKICQESVQRSWAGLCGAWSELSYVLGKRSIVAPSHAGGVWLTSTRCGRGGRGTCAGTCLFGCIAEENKTGEAMA